MPLWLEKTKDCCCNNSSYGGLDYLAFYFIDGFPLCCSNNTGDYNLFWTLFIYENHGWQYEIFSNF